MGSLAADRPGTGRSNMVMCILYKPNHHQPPVDGYNPSHFCFFLAASSHPTPN